jgi:hypothetical protein
VSYFCGAAALLCARTHSSCAFAAASAAVIAGALPAPGAGGGDGAADGWPPSADAAAFAVACRSPFVDAQPNRIAADKQMPIALMARGTVAKQRRIVKPESGR